MRLQQDGSQTDKIQKKMLFLLNFYIDNKVPLYICSIRIWISYILITWILNNILKVILN